MKKFFIFITAGLMMVLGTTSCNKNYDDAEQNNLAKGAQMIVDIQGLPMSVTKADYQTENEKKVSQVDIAIYDASGVLEWSKHYNEARTTRQTITGLTEGNKTVAVATNLSIETIPTTLAAFKAYATDLKDNSRSNLVMFGSAEGVATSNPEPIQLKLARVAAKFSLEGVIKTVWEGDAPASFDITDIYVANAAVASNFSYSGTAGPAVNLRSATELTDDPVYKDLTVASKSTWNPGEAFNGGVDFYAYPNADATRTCIMIKALYEGKVRYYPLVINQEIKNNTMYKIGDITITCEGCENPWDDFTKIKILFDIEVVDWDYNEVYPEFVF